MSNVSQFTELLPSQPADVGELVVFYNQQIDAIHNDPKRMTEWSPFDHEQITNIIEDRHKDLLILREKLGEAALGNIVGGVIVDQDFSAWSPHEVYPSEPRHFAKFLAQQGLGRSALWPALLEYGKTNNISMYVAEAWDFSDTLREDKLRKYYESLGMEWQGTVVYQNDYYEGKIIGRGRPVNRFVYQFPEYVSSQS
jgi:hypothetical protein